MNSIKEIIKAEIHVHLEATITPKLCKKFADRNKINIPENIFGSDYAYAWDDFYDFIKRYDVVTSFSPYLNINVFNILLLQFSS